MYTRHVPLNNMIAICEPIFRKVFSIIKNMYFNKKKFSSFFN